MSQTDTPAPRPARRWARVALVVAALVVLAVAWHPSRVTLQTLALVPGLLEVEPDPLALAPEPRHQLTTYTTADGERLPADLWLPATASPDTPAGALVLVSGINSAGRDHPALARVARTLSRAGAAISIPELPFFFRNEVDVTEIDRIVAAFQALVARPEVDPDRVGIMGISIGGSLSLIAAADPSIADRVRWVMAFGAYADVAEIVASVAGHQYEADGELVDWEPTLLVRELTMAMILDQVPNDLDRNTLGAAYQATYLDGGHPLSDARLHLRTRAARVAEDLLLAATLPDARRALARAAPEVLDGLAALSPLGRVGDIGARVYLMHDLGDHHIPYVHSRQLAAALEAAGADYRLGEFRLFDHVQPNATDLLAAAPEIWKLFWFLREVAADTL